MKLSRRGKSARRGRHTKRAGKHLRYKGKKVRGSKRYHRGHKRTHKRGRRLQRGGVLTADQKAAALKIIQDDIRRDGQTKNTNICSLLTSGDRYLGKYMLAYKKNVFPFSIGSSKTSTFSIYQNTNYTYLHRCPDVAEGNETCQGAFEIILMVPNVKIQNLPFTAKQININGNPTSPTIEYTFPEEPQNKDSLVLLQEIQSDTSFK